MGWVPGALRHRRLRLLPAGRGLGDLGAEMLPVAMVGLVLVEHGPLLLGLVLGVRGAAGSLFALLTGALLTRVRKSTALARTMPVLGASLLLFLVMDTVPGWRSGDLSGGRAPRNARPGPTPRSSPAPEPPTAPRPHSRNRS
ncbi:hypothetical protein ACWGSK_02555 [Nocardiopsis sp. NPDC055551]